MAAMVFLALLYLFFDTKLIQLRFELNETDFKLAKLYDENRELAAKVSALRSLPRIAEIAEKKLGMKRPEEVRYIKTSNQ
jgi:cell division protein FtsL